MNNNKVQAIVEKVKELVQRGNVSRIVVRKGERVLLNIPVNVGIVGGVVAVASAKWVLLASILATVGFGCSVEVVKEDGNIVNVMSEEDTRRVRTAAQSRAQAFERVAVIVRHTVKEVLGVENDIFAVAFEKAAGLLYHRQIFFEARLQNALDLDFSALADY